MILRKVVFNSSPKMIFTNYCIFDQVPDLNKLPKIFFQ